MYPLQMLAKCPLTKCPLTKCPLAKRPLAICPDTTRHIFRTKFVLMRVLINHNNNNSLFFHRVTQL